MVPISLGAFLAQRSQRVEAQGKREMLNNKVITAGEAIALIRDNDVIATTGFVQSCIPEALHAALEKRFVEAGAPKGLTLIMCAGAGDSKGLGTGRLHHEGLLRRVIAANFGRMPKVAQAAQDNKIQGYNLPQGVISKLFRTCASGQPGLFSKVGLHTYVDPRLGGGKVNEVTSEDLVKLVEAEGREWLFYKATPVDVALIRATSADPSGNLSMEKECLTLDVLAQAMAAHNNGGIVIAQVERIVEQGSIKPKDVKVPCILVDCVVVADPPELHRMNYGVIHDPALAGEVRVPVEGMARMEHDERKIIARRAAFELPPNGVINLGVGAPDGVAAVANEEKVTPYVVMTTEAGAVGGVLASEHQQVRRPVERLWRLHRHLAERAGGGICRHLHRWRSRRYDRGRQAQDPQGGQGTQVRTRRRAGDFQRHVCREAVATRHLRHRALRVPTDARRSGAD